MRRSWALIGGAALLSAAMTGLAAPASGAPSLPASSAASSNAAATSATGQSATTGVYSPFAGPRRLLDTGDRGQRPLYRGTTRTVAVAGHVGVPRDATAVALTVTVIGSRADGSLDAAPLGASSVAVLDFTAGRTATATAIERLGRGGALAVRNDSRGSLRLVVGIDGYYRSAAAGTAGAFVPLTPRTVLATHLPRRRTVPVAVTGTAGVPTDASAVVLEMGVDRPARAGALTVYPYAVGSATVPATTSLVFGAHQSVRSTVVVAVGDGRSISVHSSSAGTVPVQAQVVGYDVAGSPVAPGAVGALSPDRVLDTRTGRHPLAAGAQLTLHVAGAGGVPRVSVRSVALAISVVGSRAGALTVWSSGRSPSVAAVSFPARTTASGFVLAPVDSHGDVHLRNASRSPVTLTADVSGFVQGRSLAAPTVTASRYVTSLADIGGTGAGSEGCADGASGARFVLLDIGAQTVTDLGGARGVELVLGGNDPTRATYAALDSALENYVTSFASCVSDAAVAHTIALGTNNDGQFDPRKPDYYAPWTRGRDWATQVVDEVQGVTSAVRIVGADDIEGGFSSTEEQAQQWETNYLDATTADLVYNGSLDGCPDVYGATGTSCLFGWTLPEYVRLTYGNAPGRISVLPQLYYANHPDQAAQWVDLDRVAGRHLRFTGSLTQSGLSTCGSGCGYSGTSGWAALVNGLASLTPSPSVPFATNLLAH